MKVYVPDYYKEFKCIADQCEHTCCKGWEVEIDDESMKRFSAFPDIASKIESGEDNHFRLLEEETCPFLQEDGLCEMILRYGEDMLCQTCTDHPRFRNYWSDRIEMGLGLVCEEAARLILSRRTSMKLVMLSEDDEPEEESTEDEAWLMELRDELLTKITGESPWDRLKEYLIFRHLPDALYDDRVEERIAYADFFISTAKERWMNTDQSFEALVEVVRELSYDLEYDEDAKEKLLEDLHNK